MLPRPPESWRMQHHLTRTTAYRRFEAPQLRRHLHGLRYRIRRPGTAVAASKDAKDQDPELLKQVMNYCYEVDTPDGHLVVSVLRSELLPRVADLLTDTFVDTKGIQPYRRYVRRNIHTYLEQHSKMPPSAVILTAILRTQVPVDTVDTLMLEDLHESAAGQDRSATDNDGADSNSSSSSGSGAPAASHRPQHSSVTHHSDREQQQASSNSSTDHSTGSNSSGGVIATITSSSSSSSLDGLGDIVRSALQQITAGLGLQQQQRMRTVEQLVGVTEVSFREFTRSSYLTLNPPKKCAYLCNMAVGTEWRRRGIAGHLITAVEDLCCLAGETDVYLHLRLKDIDSAGGLYNKAGFMVHQKDWPIIMLLGQEPRYLMKKQLTTSRQLVGQVHLAQEQQQAGEQTHDVVITQQGSLSSQVTPAASPAA